MILPSRRGLKATTVVGAVLALTVALFSGALLLRSQLRQALDSSIASQTQTRASGVADLVATGDFTSVLKAAGPNPGWIQVIDSSGAVVAATANAASLRVPFATITGGVAAIRTLEGLPIDTGERVSVATVSARHGQDRYTVLAASPLDLADGADRRIITSLLAVFPSLLIISALIIWLVVERALRPVEAIRSEVAMISSSDLSRRVPQPGTNDEIDRLASTMNEMLDRLETSTARQRRFVGDASHELRSPLASLRGQLEVSTLDRSDPAWKATVENMLRDHDRLDRLLGDLLLLARHDDHQTIDLEPVDLGFLVRSDLARRPPCEGIERIVHATNGLVMGDADALSRILRNLVDNAERHAATAVTIEVGRSADGATTQLTVNDDGPGIPVDQRSIVFERFARLDDARLADAGGSGLGLAIVADLVRSHHGTVMVAPTDVGSRVVVRLPSLLV
jgi:signal transduction histidine kinase